MLYYLFDYLETHFNFPGAGLFQFITFRAAAAFILALLVSSIYGKRIINFLRKQQVGESIRDLGLAGQIQKAGTPTMGGIIIIFSTLIPVLLLTKLNNIYIIILLITTIWMGLIGFLDDYIKVFKKDKSGLKGKFKILGQVGLGLIVGSILYFNDSVTIKEQLPITQQVVQKDGKRQVFGEAHKSTKTTVPFFKNNELDYSNFLSFLGEGHEKYGWIVFIFITIFIIATFSNGANLTDGIDGLATGSSAIIVLVLALFAWVSGNIIFSDYLDVMYIPNSGEMTVYILAFAGALIGFLWYNTYPAQVFMGDVGSLSLGAALGIVTVIIRHEYVLLVMGGLFVIEALSVIVQVTSFKLTGKRVFNMAPLHHHYELKGWPEPRVIVRFWIITFMLVLLGLALLRLR